MRKECKKNKRQAHSESIFIHPNLGVCVRALGPCAVLVPDSMQQRFGLI